MWQQQVARHGAISFSQNAENGPPTNAGRSSDQPIPTYRRRRPWSDARQSGVHSTVASKRLHPHNMLQLLSKLLLTAPNAS
jgi:hypothetical protein